MMYPVLNDDTRSFYEWAATTTYGDLINDSYWRESWGLSYNTSSFMAEAWSDANPFTETYAVIDDAIRVAFGVDLTIDYRYTNEADPQENPGYYQECAPFQCVWFVATKKTMIEIITAMFGILGGIHAALFVILNGICGGYRRWKGIEFISETEEKEKLETEMVLHSHEVNVTGTRM